MYTKPLDFNWSNEQEVISYFKKNHKVSVFLTPYGYTLQDEAILKFEDDRHIIANIKGEDIYLFTFHQKEDEELLRRYYQADNQERIAVLKKERSKK
ncbi:MAG: hypothetical protein QM669_02065 [Siphonobacter sp.]